MNNFRLIQNINQKGGNKMLILSITLISLSIIIGLCIYFFKIRKKDPIVPPKRSPHHNSPSKPPPSESDNKPYEIVNGDCIQGCVQDDYDTNNNTCLPDSIKKGYVTENDARNACSKKDDCDGFYINYPNRQSYLLRRFCGKIKSANSQFKPSGFFNNVCTDNYDGKQPCGNGVGTTYLKK